MSHALSNDGHKEVDSASTADHADMDIEDELETSRILDRETTAPTQPALAPPTDVIQEKATGQPANEGPEADEPESEMEWAPYERNRQNVQLDDGASIKWLTNKGVYTFPKLRDKRPVRQLYPTPANCDVVRPSC